MKLIYDTSCPSLQLSNRGKVRDVYDFPKRLLLVATDRLSSHDVVSEQPIPDKGRVLTAMSVFWFGWLAANLPWLKTHFITANWDEIVRLQPEVAPYVDQLAGRSMLVHKVDRIIPIEVIIRLFLYGSGWKDYQKTGMVCGIKLPEGMKQADALPVPTFTPSTKAPQGSHDENISVEQAIEKGLVTQTEITTVGAVGCLILKLADDFAAPLGIRIPDTKLEFGVLNGELLLADEVLTPDSSRFWPTDQYQPGGEQPSLDKQFVREYLEGLMKEGKWNKQSPMPMLPPDIISGTTERYLKALCMLTGQN